MKIECSVVPVLVGFIAGGSLAQQPPPDYGHNFITIGDAGNPGYSGLDPFNNFTGRGAVDYEYRISRTEVTSAQYVEYLNARITAGFPASTIRVPRLGGVVYDFVNNRWITSAGGDMLPVGGISWRNAAIYMNWLHNGKGTEAADFMSGAYDVSTFGDNGDQPRTFTDQTTRSPGARYWIPSLDEWTKAGHWDPNKNGPGQGGYWEFSHTSDTQPIPGLPGVGETTADLPIEDADAFLVALESYPETRSPWGLLDLSGGGAEWTEAWTTPNGQPATEARIWQGAGGGNSTISPGDDNFDDILGIDRTTDRIWEVGARRPTEPTAPYITFRIASAIPAPGVGVPLLAVGVSLFARRRRRSTCIPVHSSPPH